MNFKQRVLGIFGQKYQQVLVSENRFLTQINHSTPVIPSEIIERLSYQMLFFKCRLLFIKNAKIWSLFSLRNKNKNKSRNLDLTLKPVLETLSEVTKT